MIEPLILSELDKLFLKNEMISLAEKIEKENLEWEVSPSIDWPFSTPIKWTPKKAAENNLILRIKPGKFEEALKRETYREAKLRERTCDLKREVEKLQKDLDKRKQEIKIIEENPLKVIVRFEDGGMEFYNNRSIVDILINGKD